MLDKTNTVDIYNKYMGGVDKANMMISFQRNKIRRQKKYKRIVFHFVDVCMINAWVLSKNMNNDWPHWFNFKLNIISLIKAAMPDNMKRSDFLSLAPTLPSSGSDPVQDREVSST